MINSVEDLKTLRNYVLGVAGFATTVSAILIQALHFPTEPTLICVAGFALVMLLIGFLINRAEQRQALALKKHQEESDKTIQEFKGDLSFLKTMALENQRSGLRNEMNGEIYRNPANHDTILQLARRYFVEMGGDWVQTDLFLSWAEKENAKGRPVHIPVDLSQAVAKEKTNQKK